MPQKSLRKLLDEFAYLIVSEPEISQPDYKGKKKELYTNYRNELLREAEQKRTTIETRIRQYVPKYEFTNENSDIEDIIDGIYSAILGLLEFFTVKYMVAERNSNYIPRRTKEEDIFDEVARYTSDYLQRKLKGKMPRDETEVSGMVDELLRICNLS